MKKIIFVLIFITAMHLYGHADVSSAAISHNGPDTDGDLMPDQWETAYGLNPNDPADADLDPDGDRLTNRDEFFAGTNPKVFNSSGSLTEAQLLSLFEGKAFLYFWEQSRPPYYFTADNANYNNKDQYSNNFNSIATTGFGMMALAIADERGWVNHEAAYNRILALLSRAVELQGASYDRVGVPVNQEGSRHGYLYHFVDNQGLRYPGVEISTIDHALFVAGALVAGEYYKGTQVEQLARQLYLNTDWNWLYNGTFLYQGWIEDASGTFEGGRTIDLWNRYSELLILEFLAMGSPDASKAIPAAAWDNLTYGAGRMFPYEYAHLFPGDAPQNFAFVSNMPNTINQPGYTNSATGLHYIHAGSLHNHQYSHLFADFRYRRDKYQTDFFANSISATMANRQYCINLNTHSFGGDPASADPYLRQPYETYGPDSWGIMAGVPSFTGYALMQPIVMSWDNFSPDNIAVNNDSGTVLLSAPLGSTPFAPRQAIDFTRNMLTRFQNRQGGYNDLVGRYGFMNSFNLGRPYKNNQVGHFATGIIGLDMGPVSGSAENFNSGLVWKMSMRNQFIQAGMQKAGFNTGVVEPYILNFDDNPPAPQEDTNAGGVDPNSFGGRSYAFGAGSISYFWIGDPFPALSSGPQQWAQRISAANNSDSGAFITLKNHGVSRWDILSFWVKGDAGTEQYSVGLKGSVTDPLGNAIQATEVKLPIASYHPNGAISTSWINVKIPLRDFNVNGVRLAALDNISFTCTKSAGGTIYVDDIEFLSDNIKPSAPIGLSATVSGASVTLTWTISPEADVAGYNVYRSDDNGTTYKKISQLLVVPTRYADANLAGRKHIYKVTAVDNAQAPNESAMSASVTANTDNAPVLSAIGNRSVNENSLLQFTLYAVDADSDPLTYSVSALPAGAAFSNKVFKWTPTYSQAGVYTVTFTVSDGALTDSEAVVITVNNVNRAPALGALTPASGASRANAAVTFTAAYTDPDGYADIGEADLLVNTVSACAKCLCGYYNRATNKLYLRDDADTAWVGGYAPGSANVIENSYAKLNCLSTSASGSGSSLTVKWNVTFKSTFTGAKKVYLKVIDTSNACAGWTQKGTWTVNP